MRHSLPSPALSPSLPDSHESAAALLRVCALAQSKGYAHGLKPSQWTALRYFSDAAAHQRTVSAFSAYHGTTRGAASQMVEVLVGKGLLTRTTASDDRRVVLLQLTPRAQELIRQDPLRDFANVIAALPMDKQHDLAGALQSLLRLMLPG